jgi:hypothetical protein
MQLEIVQDGLLLAAVADLPSIQQWVAEFMVSARRPTS